MSPGPGLGGSRGSSPGPPGPLGVASSFLRGAAWWLVRSDNPHSVCMRLGEKGVRVVIIREILADFRVLDRDTLRRFCVFGHAR